MKFDELYKTLLEGLDFEGMEQPSEMERYVREGKQIIRDNSERIEALLQGTINYYRGIQKAARETNYTTKTHLDDIVQLELMLRKALLQFREFGPP